jgi:hypothetical protein
VKPGTQITWTNGDDIPHTVVSDTKAFKSKVLATGEKYTYTAAKAGRISIRLFHPSQHDRQTSRTVASTAPSRFWEREECPGVPWGLAFETWDPPGKRQSSSS